MTTPYSTDPLSWYFVPPVLRSAWDQHAKKTPLSSLDAFLPFMTAEVARLTAEDVTSPTRCSDSKWIRLTDPLEWALNPAPLTPLAERIRLQWQINHSHLTRPMTEHYLRLVWVIETASRLTAA